MNKILYRKEIDGLRAIAVISIILFHAKFDLFSGGFIGVDIFFVISGYLITSIIITEKQAGNFSILNFYERRARRILPSLLFIIICCAPLAWVFMMPNQLIDFANSAFYASSFTSNFYFFMESGYFSPSMAEKPLFHTWSLAVEGQYYILFPLFIALFWSQGIRFVVILIAFIALASLAISEFRWRYYSDANFYLLPTRIWEIAIGALCAFYLIHKKKIKGRQFPSLIGLGLIIFSIFMFDKNIPVPSVYALIPILGTVLIILFARQGTTVSKILSKPIFVGIGLISYSAYL